MASHHASAGNILKSLDNFLAETVEGSREPFNPHSPTPGRPNINTIKPSPGHPEIKIVNGMVNGMASVDTGCKQCHGSVVSLEATDGSLITYEELKPDENGIPTNKDVVKKIRRVGKEGDDSSKRPVISSSSWPNTGIGRLNLDGSRGSCSACHSRHDFSPRRARQPENCGKCHLGPDHPQKEIYEESKHGVAYRDLKDKMNLNSKTWVLGEDYSAAPTCATCHMSANKTDKKITHDPGTRISWTNRPPISAVMDTDKNGKVIKEKNQKKRAALIADSWQNKRNRMKNVCMQCHTEPYVNAFYKQYDDFVVNYNEKFAKPGDELMKLLLSKKVRTKQQFDEEIEWTWFYLWHHEGRRARHGASMMAPDYAHWHGMYEVAERFYMEFIPQAREMAEHAKKHGNADGAKAVDELIEKILNRPEHKWYEKETKKRKVAGKKDAEAKKGNKDGPIKAPDPDNKKGPDNKDGPAKKDDPDKNKPPAVKDSAAKKDD